MMIDQEKKLTRCFLVWLYFFGFSNAMGHGLMICSEIFETDGMLGKDFFIDDR